MSVITDYTSLQTAVGDFLARDDLTTFTENFIQNWEERFYRQHKNYGPWLEAALSGDFSSTLTVPTDFLALKSAYLSGLSSPPLIVSSLDQIYTKYPRTQSGQPRWIARNGANFEFGPLPDGTYTIAGSYYAKPALLRDASTNYLTENAPDLLLYGALVEASPFLKNDDRMALWQAKHDEALSEYRDLQRSGNYSGSAPQILVA